MTDRDFAPDFRNLASGGPSLEEYGRFQQHLVLLEDAGRIASFRRAIESIPPGDTVMDVGAGTGVLALLALRHGFRHAILVEPSRKMATYARHLAALNGFESRVTVVESRLEDIALDSLPSLDLVVSETLSSFIFGFGSWDALPQLARRVRDPRHVIPYRGTLLIAPVERAMASRGPDTDGLKLLAEAGVRIDLFERAFRSAGNVYDKASTARALARGEAVATELASFDFAASTPFSLSRGTTLRPPLGGAAVGALVFWDIQLSALRADDVFTNLDPRVTSWFPYYVAFRRPVDTATSVTLELVPCDAPYTYAFRLMGDGEPLTHTLYW